VDDLLLGVMVSSNSARLRNPDQLRASLGCGRAEGQDVRLSSSQGTLYVRRHQIVFAKGLCASE
jgi:hypothetical protein